MSENEIWYGDKLNRKEQAELFGTVIRKEYELQKNLSASTSKDATAADPEGSDDTAHTRKPDDTGHNLIINIDAEYGLGKTFFVQRWSKMLKNEGHPSVLFDAWKNDYTQEPLEPLLAEILKQLEKQLYPQDRAILQRISNYTSFKNLKKLAPKLLKSAVPVAANVAALYLTGAAPFKDDIKDWLPDLSERLASEALSHHNERENSIAEFKKAMRELIDSAEQDNFAMPVYIFIDELDRCRPTYAIELLERIKHIFDIEGLCFVFCTTTSQLAASIRSVYGSDFKAEDYLRRFFNHTYALAAPDYTTFAQHLFETRGQLKDLINDRQASVFYGNDLHHQNEINEATIDAFTTVSKAFGLTLRDQEQLYTAFKIFVETIITRKPTGVTIHLHWPLILLAIKLFKPVQHQQMKSYGDLKWKIHGPTNNPSFSETFGSNDQKVSLKLVYTDRFQKVKKCSYRVTLQEILATYSTIERESVGNIEDFAFKERDSIPPNDAFEVALYRCVQKEIEKQRPAREGTLAAVSNNPLEAMRNIIDTLIYKPH